MPLHYITNIFLTSKRQQTTEGIQLAQQSYLRYSFKNKRERRINYTTRPPRGGNPLTVLVQVLPVVNQYDTKQEVVDHTSDHLSEHFHLAYSALCYQGQLFDDLGFMGDTECSKQILKGTYDYPPDTNVCTKKILWEAHYNFSHISCAKITTTISTTDFQKYWIKVDKRMSSSFSGVTFLHYKAAASHSMLLVMHTVYLSACARKGIPLARWGIGLTMLLQKIVSNNFVHKLRAICLLEADFNWINKIVFAKQMIESALERNLIPGKSFSKKGSNCINAVMIKNFICNKSRIHHHDACIAGNDFRDFYDQAAHPVAAILF
jgi:hypothetical protein